MIQRNLNYDKVKDISSVDQFGFVDLRGFFEHGVIPGDLSVDSRAYNDIENPENIVGKPSDVFDAMRYQDNALRAIDEVAKKSAGTAEKK